MMYDIIQSIRWKSDSSSVADKTIILLDEGYAEYFRWRSDSFSDHGSLSMSPIFMIPVLDSPLSLSSNYKSVSVSALVDSISDHRGSTCRIVVFTCDLLPRFSTMLKTVLVSCSTHCHIQECVIFSSMACGLLSSISHMTHLTRMDADAYMDLQDVFHPINTTVEYLPLHTIQLLKREMPPLNEHPDVELGVLLSLEARYVRPLTQNSLMWDRRSVADKALLRSPHSQSIGHKNDHDRVDIVLDLNASDLSANMKTHLKVLAHELAGSLVHDYGLDVSANIHAIGKTALILGHNILPFLEQLSGADPLLPAGLVIIDRLEDMLTPASCTTATVGKRQGSVEEQAALKRCPIAHRMQNTLRYCQYSPGLSQLGSVHASVLCDVLLSCPLLASPAMEGEDPTTDDRASCEHKSDDTTTLSIGLSPAEQLELSRAYVQPLLDPMTAMGSLPLQVKPSLLYKPQLDPLSQQLVRGGRCKNDKVLQHLMSRGEEEGRDTLCAEIKSRIKAELGSFPPSKKRGLGAEVLAYTQALLLAPGGSQDPLLKLSCVDNSADLGYRPVTCMRSIELISLSYAVIESMQRSSAKQFSSICDWQCAFEYRAQREADLDDIAHEYQDFDVCLAHLSAYALVDTNTTGAAAVGKHMHHPDYSRSRNSPPMDAVHLLVQLVRLTGLFREMDTYSSDLAELTSVLGQHLLLKSPIVELHYLHGLEVLDAAAVKDILEHRSLSSVLEESINRQIELYEMDDACDRIEQERVDARVAELETRCAQLASSVRDEVSSSIQSIDHLRSYYNSRRKKRSSSGDTISMFNLLDGNAYVATHYDPKQEVFIKRRDTDNELLGLVARVALSYLVLRARSLHSLPHRAGLLSGGELEYIETAMQKVKRAGLGLLSKGLGSLGFGGAISTNQPPPLAARPILVLFVLGGLSYLEVRQVQTQLLAVAAPNTRIILLSSSIIGAEHVLHAVFEKR